MSGRGIVESGVFRSEQVSRLARTTDPASPAKGDAWIRTDVQPVTDSVAALRIQGDTGYLEAPLFDPAATTGADVYVGKRFLFDDGTEGHLLVTDQGGAVGSPRIVTSSGTLYETHDALEVNAIPASDIAQFEDGSLNNSFEGATSDYEVTDVSPVLSGSFSLKSTVDNAGNIYSFSGLDRYPEAGQRIACYMNIDSDELSYFAFGAQSAVTDYGVGLNASYNELEVIKNSFNTRVTSGFSVSGNAWYDVEAEWKSDEIVGRVFDVDSNGERQGSALATATLTDSEYSSGGIGFINGSGNGQSVFDNYRILEAL